MSNPYIMPLSIDKNGANPGAAREKLSYVYLYDITEIAHFPEFDPQTASYVGSMTLVEGAHPLRLYVTAETQAFSYETTGEADAMGLLPKVTGSYPGYNEEIAALVSNKLGSGFVAISVSPEGVMQMAGTVGSPLYMSSTLQDDKDANRVNLEFTARLATGRPIVFYKGALPTGDEVAIASDATSINASAGHFFRIETGTASSVTIETISGGSAGDVITLIGSFGSHPAVVEATSSIILEGGQSWMAEEGSTLTLKAYSAGSSILWIEQGRK